MKEKDVDYKYSLDLLKRIYSVEKNGTRISNLFIYEGYNLWQTYRQQMFQEIKSFSQDSKLNPSPSRSHITFVKDMLMGIFLLFSSLVSYALSLLSGKKVLVYAVDRVNSAWHSDFRLETLYEFLHKKNISYTEIFHTIPERETFVRFLKRKRFSLYIEAIDWLLDIGTFLGLIKKEDIKFVDDLDLTSFSDEEKVFVRALICKYVIKTNRTKIRIRALTLLLKYSPIEVVFAIDDTRSYYEIVAAANFAKIPVYAIQHGHFTKYHVGWIKGEGVEGDIFKPNYILVWSDYWKDELLRLKGIVSNEQIVVAGTKEVISYDDISEESSEGKGTTILIPYETVCPKKEVAEYIRKLLLCKEVRIIFKLRPDIGAETQLEEYGLKDFSHERFSYTTSEKDILKNVDIVAGTYSTFLYDMIAKAKRAVILKSTSDYGEGLVMNTLADQIDGTRDICAQIADLQKRPKSEIIDRKRKLYGSEPLLLEETLARIAKELKLL